MLTGEGGRAGKGEGKEEGVEGVHSEHMAVAKLKVSSGQRYMRLSSELRYMTLGSTHLCQMILFQRKMSPVYQISPLSQCHCVLHALHH